jgi:hypothetical protein
MLKEIFGTILLIWLSFPMFAQCSVFEIPLETRIKSATQIVEGKVIEQKSFWDKGKKKILTSNTIEVYKILKGNTPPTIEVITEGGIVGDDRLEVSGGLIFNVGTFGVFMLSPVNERFAFDLKSEMYCVYANKQGFLKYDSDFKNAVSIFDAFGIGEKFYSILSGATSYKVIKSLPPLPSHQVLKVNPVITDIQPREISAGTSSRLTIRGGGFGNTPGIINFRNADNGGGNFVNPFAREIIKWEDQEIVVEVPSTAGTGHVQVIVEGIMAQSTQVLTINWAQTNMVEDLQSFQPYLISKEKSGGYVWQMNRAFKENTAANEAFIRVFNQWRCQTGINWFLGEDTDVDEVLSDNISVIRFDQYNELAPGTLGVCYTWYKACRPTRWYVSEMDLVFSNRISWNFGPGLPVQQYDFETVALHELGHGHQLGHVINKADLMHYSIARNDHNRVVSADNLAGGDFVMYRSTQINVCNNSPMDFLPEEICEMPFISDFEYNGLLVYPNPVTATLHMKFNLPEKTKLSLEIYNTMGTLIYAEKETEVPIGIYEPKINIGNLGLSSGIYFLRLTRNTNKETMKIIVN